MFVTNSTQGSKYLSSFSKGDLITNPNSGSKSNFFSRLSHISSSVQDRYATETEQQINNKVDGYVEPKPELLILISDHETGD